MTDHNHPSPDSTDPLADPGPEDHFRLFPAVSAVKCLLFLAVLYMLHFAQAIIVPLLLTALIALLLNPLVSLLKRFYVPRALSAVLLLTLLVMPLTLLGIELVEPAQKWAKLVPKLSVNLTDKINALSETFEAEQNAVRDLNKRNQAKENDDDFDFFGWFEEDEPEPVETPAETNNVVTEKLKLSGIDIAINMMSAAPTVIAQLLSGLVLILFLLIFGPALFEAYMESLPSPREKKHALKLVNALQKELSRYILTVSTVNVALGVATAAVLHFLGMEDALLWGAMVGLLNFIPYLGSVIGVIVLIVAAVVQYGLVVGALIPVGAYLTLNLIESQLVTPTLLGRNMKINPLVVMLWLLVCAWLWGIVGVLLSVPLLVCIKLTLSHLNVWKNGVRVMESG